MKEQLFIREKYNNKILVQMKETEGILLDYPLVSILMSVYNSNVKTLKKVLNSIENQTYKNIEIVIVNDGSTLLELNELLKELEMRENIIIIQRKENKGLIYSLNEGLDLCNGEFTARVDDDDIPNIDRISKQVFFLMNNLSISAVGGWAEIVQEDGKVLTTKKYPSTKKMKKTIAFRSPISHSLVMYRTDVIKNIGKYDYKYEKAEDYALFLKLLKNGYSLDNLQEVLGSQKFTLQDVKKRDRLTRKSVLYAKVKYFNYNNFFTSAKGLIFSLLWWSLPQYLVKKAYKQDTNKSLFYN